MFRLINNLKNKKGFTLIELIVVLAVLAVIMAIAVPRFIGVQDKAKVDADESTLASIAKISELYLVKGDFEKDKSYTGTTLTNIIGDDFPNGVDFQSDGNTSHHLSDVTVNISSTGAISVSVGSGSSEVSYTD